MWLVVNILESAGRMNVYITIFSKIVSFSSTELQQSDP